jgi:hypothetical protein
MGHHAIEGLYACILSLENLSMGINKRALVLGKQLAFAKNFKAVMNLTMGTICSINDVIEEK